MIKELAHFDFEVGNFIGDGATIGHCVQRFYRSQKLTLPCCRSVGVTLIANVVRYLKNICARQRRN